MPAMITRVCKGVRCTNDLIDDMTVCVVRCLCVCLCDYCTMLYVYDLIIVALLRCVRMIYVCVCLMLCDGDRVAI